MGHFSQEDYDKLNDRDPKGGGTASEWFRPSHDKNTGQDRKYVVRLLPLSLTDPYPFYYHRMHYVYGDPYISGACPQSVSNEDSCPFCDMFFKLWNVPELSGDANAGLRKSLQKLGPDQRAFANVWDPEVERVRAWSIAYGARKKLEAKIDSRREQGVLVTDPEDGRDLVVTASKLGKNSKISDVDVSETSTPVPIADWANQLKNLTDCACQRVLTTDELAELIPAVLGDHYKKLAELYARYADTIGEEI